MLPGARGQTECWHFSHIRGGVEVIEARHGAAIGEGNVRATLQLEIRKPTGVGRVTGRQRSGHVGDAMRGNEVVSGGGDTDEFVVRRIKVGPQASAEFLP